MLICVAVGILAVDFPVYPRRLAKAETYGFGLMDTGVGYFIVGNALISPEARGRQKHISFTRSMTKAFKSSLPLLVLGFARLASVKSLDYQEHVSEYGVHWNFFFTLSILKVRGSFYIAKTTHECKIISLIKLTRTFCNTVLSTHYS